jgi:hypothetical protein
MAYRFYEMILCPGVGSVNSFSTIDYLYEYKDIIECYIE